MEKSSKCQDFRARLRERFKNGNIALLLEDEILEGLLRYAMPVRDAQFVAPKLVEQFGSLGGVLSASLQELEETAELSPDGAVLLRVVKEACIVSLQGELKNRDLLNSPSVVADFARIRLAGPGKEAFMLIYVNSRHEVLDCEIIQEGTVDHAMIYPRQVFEGALARHASGLFLVHNHPSGHVAPSCSDKNLTKTLVKIAVLLDIDILDHIIVGSAGYYSFVENKLICKLM